MKVTSYKENGTTVLKVEGEMVGVAVIELKRCWRDVVRANKAEKIQLDLSATTYADDVGKAMMAIMHRAGVELVAVDVLMKSVVEEIKQPQYDIVSEITD